MRTIWVALLLMVPAVHAGSVDDPEVTDPTGDSIDDIKDILKVWIEDGIVIDSEGRESLVVALQLAVDDPDMSSLFALHERVRIAFKGDFPGAPDAHEFYVLAQPNVGTQTETGEARFICNFGMAPEEGGSADISTEMGMDEGEWDGAMFECILPLEFIGGEAAYGQTLSDIWAVYQVVQRGPTSSEDEAGVNTHDLDRAPDSDYGRDYVVYAPPAASAPIAYAELDALPFTNRTEVPTNGTLQLNHTGAGSFLVNASAERGSIALNVTGPDGIVFADNGTEIQAEIDGCADACNMTFRFTFDGFVGTYSIEPAPGGNEGPGGNGTGDPDAPGGNGTADGNATGGADKGSPFVAVPLAMVAVAVIAARRRRD